jgi:hypothetical protein
MYILEKQLLNFGEYSSFLGRYELRIANHTTTHRRRPQPSHTLLSKPQVSIMIKATVYWYYFYKVWNILNDKQERVSQTLRAFYLSYIIRIDYVSRR